LRDLKARYRQSVLGYLWIFILPLTTSSAFILLNRTNLFSSESSEIPYPFFVMVGTLLWQSFVDGVNGPFRIFKSQLKIFEKSETPPEVILISLANELIFNFLTRYILISLLLLPFDKFRLVNSLFALPIALGIPLLGACLGLLFLPWMCLFKDLEQLITALLMFLFYVTPIVYSVPKLGAIGYLADFNPISIFVNGSRDAIALGDFSSYLQVMTLLFGFVLISCLCWLIFRITIPFLVERML
jgi:lipopolysaccharide transport system permease protein